MTVMRPPRDTNQRPQRERDTGPRANRQIRAESVRVVGHDGEMLGVMSLRDALAAAERVGLDLVEVSPNAEPPVCKILDYGKYKYEMQKKAHEAKKKQKVVHIKEIKIRPMIDPHDYEVKMRSVRKFLEEGDKVKITLRWRGRETAHLEIGMALLDKVKQEVAELARIEQEPRMEGRQTIMMLAPK